MKHKNCLTWKHSKNVKNEKCTLSDLEYGEKIDQQAKCDTHNVGPEIWRKTVKNVKNE